MVDQEAKGLQTSTGCNPAHNRTLDGKWHYRRKLVRIKEKTRVDDSITVDGRYKFMFVDPEIYYDDTIGKELEDISLGLFERTEYGTWVLTQFWDADLLAEMLGVAGGPEVTCAGMRSETAAFATDITVEAVAYAPRGTRLPPAVSALHSRQRLVSRAIRLRSVASFTKRFKCEPTPILTSRRRWAWGQYT